MPARPPSSARRRPAHRRLCRKPACLCNRPLGANLLDARGFSVVACSHNCRRPAFFFHPQCAELYAHSLKSCGWCKSKLVALRSPASSTLRDAVHQRTRQSSWRRRLRKRAPTRTRARKRAAASLRA